MIRRYSNGPLGGDDEMQGENLLDEFGRPRSQRDRTRFDYDVFLSHSHKDVQIVHPLARRLREDGLKVWLDEWEIELGDSIPEKIGDGLERSRVLLMLLSENFDASDWTRYESGTFLFSDPLNKQRRFIPVRLDRAEVPFRIRHFAHLDWQQREESAYQKLLATCRREPEETTDISEPVVSTPQTPPATSSVLPEITGFGAPAPHAPALQKTLSLGHANSVWSVALTADGQSVVSGSGDNTVRVWDLSSGECTATLEGHSGSVMSVALTPDGQSVVSGSEDATVRVWDLSSGECTATLEGHTDYVRSVALTPDGQSVVSGSDDRTVRVWDLSSGECTATLEGHSGSVMSVALTPDGQSVVSGSGDNTVRVWDLSSGECTATLEGHSGSVMSVALTPDGQSVVSGSEDATVRVWDLSSGECTATLEGHTDYVRSVALTPDGQSVVSGSEDATVRVWDLSSGECTATLEGHTDYVRSVALTPDGQSVVSGSEDATVRVWDLSSGECTATLEGHTDYVRSVALTPDGQSVVSGSDDRTVRVWDLSSGECTATLEGHSGYVWSVALTADGQSVVSGSGDNTVRVWDLSSGECTATLEGHSGYVWSVALTADGQSVVSGSGDNTVRVWDLSSGECTATLEGHSGSVLSVALTADGQSVVSGSGDNTVRVWDLSSGECTATLEGHTDYVRSVALTPDGQSVVSGSDDRTVRVWDLSSGECTATLEGHSGYVWSVALTADGQSVVSGSGDNTVRVWDLSSGECTATLEGHSGEVNSVALTPNGQSVVSAASNCVLRIWSLQGLEGGGRGGGGTTRSAATSQPAATRYTNAKVLLVGESGVGKTGLARWMATGEFEETDSTDGHWATRLEASYHDDEWATRLMLKGDVDAQGTRREIWLWDFAGQADYRLIHQLFMDETSLAVLVFNPQDDHLFDNLGRWDTDIQRAARKEYHKLLVAGRTDRGVFRGSPNDMDTFLKTRRFDAYLETSAKDGTGCEELIQQICSNIDWSKLTMTVSNVTWDRLKNQILALKDGRDGQPATTLIRMNELNQRLRLGVPDLEFKPEELVAIVDRLASPGLVWKLDFGGFVLLHPERINSYAGAVARDLRNRPDSMGVISEDRLKAGDFNLDGVQRVSSEDEPILLQAMHQTFVDRGLAMRQKTGDGTQLVFPAYFGLKRPSDPDSPPLFTTYEFSGFLDDVYATLVVRLYYAPGFEIKHLWQDYAEFHSEIGSRLCIHLTRGREGRGSLKLYCDKQTADDTRVLFSRYVHEHVAEKASAIERSRHYACSKCGKVFLDDDEVRDAIKEDGENAFVYCAGRKCRAEIKLWDVIEQKLASEEFREKVRLLRDASKQAIDNESRELILVGHAFSISGEAGQIFRPVANSDHGVDGEIEFKDYAGNASGKRVYLQLKSGDSYLKDRQRDRKAIFQIKKQRWADYWIAHEYPVMLVIRTSNGTIRWLNVTKHLQRLKDAGDWPVTQIEFEGEDFTPLNLLKLRQEVLGPPPDERKM